jgi:anaerobic magnesium-protoporphyrin IX monomethyl ester cyclase
MNVLLVSGLGPTIKNAAYLNGSMLDREHGADIARDYVAGTGMSGFQLTDLGFDHCDRRYPLLRRRRGTVPHLTTFTLEAILQSAGVSFDHAPTSLIWDGLPLTSRGDHDVVLLSTSFIWNHHMLREAIDWIVAQRPEALLVVGGQFSNLKFDAVMRTCAEVDAVMRGDGEEALPRLLSVLRSGGRDLSSVPNLVWRDRSSAEGYTVNRFQYIDLDSHPTPMLTGPHPVVPYESMRGCPFRCKFCSFPFASPEWRYKSAAKIAADWARYGQENGTQFVSAMDSTFTVPPTRLRQLLDLLPPVGVEWGGYSRANSVKDAELVDRLADAHCRFLSLGFESMSDRTLSYMNKKVTCAQNLNAFSLLRKSRVGYRCSFMAGYPGETPEDYALTHDFLVNQYEGHFLLSVFSISDETMPLWEDRERFQIEVHDPDDPDYSWSHIGMDVHTARRLNYGTLDAVRLTNSNAVLMLWQADYQHWLLPHLSREENLAVEKTVERIAMAPRDVPERSCREGYLRQHLDVLREYGITVGNRAEYTDEALPSTYGA